MPPDAVPAPQKRLKVIALIVVGVIVLAGIVYAAVVWYPSYHEKKLVEDSLAAYDANDLDSALAKAEELLANDPNDPRPLVMKSLILSQKGSLGFEEELYGTQAEEAARAAIALAPEASEAWRALAYSEEIRELYVEAHASYAQAIELDPKSAASLFGDAHTYDLEGDAAKAEIGYRTAIAADENFDVAHAGLGRILLAKKEDDAALAEFHSAFALSKNVHRQAEAASTIGIIYTAKQDWPAANTWIDKATTLEPEYAFGWYAKGRATFYEGMSTTTATADQKGALINASFEYLSKANNLNENLTAVLEQLGTDFAFLGETDKALAAFAAAQGVVDKDISLTTLEKKQTKERIGRLIVVLNKLKAAEANKS